MKKSGNIAIRVTPELKIELQALADLEDRTLSDFIVLKLKGIIKQQEERYFSEKENKIKSIAKNINTI